MLVTLGRSAGRSRRHRPSRAGSTWRPSTQLMHTGGRAQGLGEGPGVGVSLWEAQSPDHALPAAHDTELYLQAAGMITSVLCILPLFKILYRANNKEQLDVESGPDNDGRICNTRSFLNINPKSPECVLSP